MIRSDGRRPDQLRPISIEPGFMKYAEGSALISVGNTRVLCAASVDETVPRWMKGRGVGWVTAEYAMLPRATTTRTTREVNKGKQSGRTHEIQRLIGRSLRSIVDMSVLGERSIFIDCDVLQADGGTRTAAITGAYVAMAIAIGTLVKYKVLVKSPILDSVSATSVGIVNGAPMLDLNYEEDSRADVDMNLVITGAGKFIEVQGTSERAPFDEPQLLQMIGLARAGISQLRIAQEQALSTRLSS